MMKSVSIFLFLSFAAAIHAQQAPVSQSEVYFSMDDTDVNYGINHLPQLGGPPSYITVNRNPLVPPPIVPAVNTFNTLRSPFYGEILPNGNRASPILRPEVAPLARPAVAPLVRPAVAPLVRPAVTPLVNSGVAPLIRPGVAPLIRPVVNPLVRPAVVPLVHPGVPRPLIRPGVAPLAHPELGPLVYPAVAPLLSSRITPFSGFPYFDYNSNVYEGLPPYGGLPYATNRDLDLFGQFINPLP